MNRTDSYQIGDVQVTARECVRPWDECKQWMQPPGPREVLVLTQPFSTRIEHVWVGTELQGVDGKELRNRLNAVRVEKSAQRSREVIEAYLRESGR